MELTKALPRAGIDFRLLYNVQSKTKSPITGDSEDRGTTGLKSNQFYENLRELYCMKW